jgi:predicted Zn finger-like uncharacterized protein
VVVQCPTCQSKFRIADDKVSDRGVRVRCTSCKNVFQVRKPGSQSSEPAPGPGNTVQLSALEAAQITRAARAAQAGGTARPAVSKPPPAARPAPRPAPASGNGAARRLDANDLFGMAELTGDAPLGDLAPKAPPPPPASARPAPKPMPNFDDIDIEVNDEPSGPPPPKPPAPIAKPSRPPPPPEAEKPRPPPPPEEDEAVNDDGSVKIGSIKSSMKDPFEGMDMGEPGTGALELSTQPRKDKLADAIKAESAKAPLKPPPEPEPLPPARAMVSSALTGLLGAALAIAVVIVSAMSDDAAAGWLGLTPGSEIVATKVVSGLFDTAAGKPVFFVRGRVENRSARVRGPVRVTAELISDGTAEAKAEAIAGSEPSPEDVWSLRTAADADRLNKSLEVAKVERKLPPGTSLPFFAVIPDPPADLQKHRLHVKVESVDAWNPPGNPPLPPKATKGR